MTFAILYLRTESGRYSSNLLISCSTLTYVVYRGRKVRTYSILTSSTIGRKT